MFDLNVLASLAPPEPPLPQPDPVLRTEGPGSVFADLLAGLGAAFDALVPPESQAASGKDLPDAAEQGGKDVPDSPPEPVALPDITLVVPLALPPVSLVPQADPALAVPQGETPAPLKPDQPRAKPLTTGTTPVADDPHLPQPVSTSERVLKPASEVLLPAPLAEVAAQLARTIEALPALVATREPAPVTTATAHPAPAPATPGTELEQLVEQLAQAREAGRGARGELAVRHAEFGTVAIRLEQADGETRATLAGRDPGFAPAVVAALADRAATGSFDQHHAPPHHRGGEPSFAGGQGDARQPDRRGAPERLPAANPAPSDREEPADDEIRRGRFA